MADTVIYGTAGNDTISSTAAGTSNGSLILTVSGSSGENMLPQFDVLINGTVVRSQIMVTANDADLDTQQVYVALPAGPINSVRIDFTNDAQNDYSLGDRNIFIYKATLNGTDLPTSSAIYTRDGFTGPPGSPTAPSIAGQAEMYWGGELTWSGSLVSNAVAGAGGSRLIDGDTGIDTVTFGGASTGFNIGHTATGFSTQAALGGTTTYYGSVERLDFTDRNIAIDMDGNGGDAARLLITLAGEEYLADENLAGLFISYLDQGLSVEALAGAILAHPDWQALAGGSSNAAYVTEMYSNLAGFAPPPEEFNYLVGLLDSGALSQAAMTMIAMDHEAVDIRMTGVMNTGLEYIAM
ncbi:MAG: carbohydrate-binding domain-containing protein [Pseudomonadota bacterium]